MASQVNAGTFPVVRWEEGCVKWDQYVQSHPKGSVFHTASMLAAFAVTPKHQVYALAAVDSLGNIVALLATVQVATIEGLASSLASRSIYYAEPLCDPTPNGRAALNQLIARHDEQMHKSMLFAEVRNLDFSSAEREPLESAGYEYRDYLNYVVNTQPETDLLWGNVSKSTRNTIRRSLRRDVEVVLDTSAAGIERMYPLIAYSYERSKVPLASIDLFRSTLEQLPEASVQIRIATHQGVDVAAGIGLLFGGRFYAWYGGSKRLRGVAPFDCLTWDEIQWCSENAMNCYDFGGAGWPDEEYGPRDFKAKFGGDLLHLGRYRKKYSWMRTAMATTTYHLIRKIRQK